MFEKQILFFKLFAYTISFLGDYLRRSSTAKLRKYLGGNRCRLALSQGTEPRNIVIIGASFAGYQAARLLSTSLPLSGDRPFRVIVVEPNSHFNFTWVLPRFCVVPEHEYKAFIPYGGYLANAPAGRIRWVKDRVTNITKSSVRLRDSGEEIPYEYLVVATGSGETDGLPSRVGKENKAEGIQLLKDVQARIRDAKRMVVVGGGAAGVELATDAKAKYQGKEVVLVHSRGAVMHRFGPELQQAALDGLKGLGVEVILGERAVSEDVEGKVLTLTSGRKVEYDYLVRCTGQKPASQILAGISPTSLSEWGYIRVKPSLQIADKSLANVYACGDVADTGVKNPNARSAMKQALVVADNITLAAKGLQRQHTYSPHWADQVIKLTLGLDKSISHFGDGDTELLFRSKEKDVALMSAGAWKSLGAKPFEEIESWTSISTVDVDASPKA